MVKKKILFHFLGNKLLVNVHVKVAFYFFALSDLAFKKKLKTESKANKQKYKPTNVVGPYELNTR